MMNRRRFVALAGSATITGLAGCSGGNNETPDNGPDTTATEEPLDIETSDGPAEFAVYDAAWADAEDVTVDNGGKVDLLIGNRGGEPGQFSGRLVVESLVSSEATFLGAALSSVDEEIGSGEAVTVTSETVTPEYSGEYEATVGNEDGERLPIADGADAELLVTPHQGTGDDSFLVKDGLRLSVKNVQFEQGLHYDTRVSTFMGSKERVSLISAQSDQTLVLVHAAVENAGNSTTTVNADWFKFGGESPVNIGNGVRDLDTDQLDGVEVNSGSRVEGWLLFRAPRDSLGEANLKVFRDPKSPAADAVWELDVGDVEFPQFELEGMDVPDQYDDDVPEHDLDFTIRNTGDGVGTFRGALQWREEGESGWEDLQPENERLKARIQPGETATVSSYTDYAR
jgi:Telomeric repeat-binding factor 2.